VLSRYCQSAPPRWYPRKSIPGASLNVTGVKTTLHLVAKGVEATPAEVDNRHVELTSSSYTRMMAIPVAEHNGPNYV
jgi:hypothetical protein